MEWFNNLWTDPAKRKQAMIWGVVIVVLVWVHRKQLKSLLPA